MSNDRTSDPPLYWTTRPIEWPSQNITLRVISEEERQMRERTLAAYCIRARLDALINERTRNMTPQQREDEVLRMTSVPIKGYSISSSIEGLVAVGDHIIYDAGEDDEQKKMQITEISSDDPENEDEGSFRAIDERGNITTWSWPDDDFYLDGDYLRVMDTLIKVSSNAKFALVRNKAGKLVKSVITYTEEEAKEDKTVIIWPYKG